MRKCDSFFTRLGEMCLAVTFDDVRLRSGYSEVPLASISIGTQFSRRVALKVPIVSAAMDTVTGAKMAIAIAKAGGIGVIHRGFTPEEQKAKVRRVKFLLSGVIDIPITVTEDMSMAEISKMREERGFTFHSFPVVNAEGRLVGLITKNDFDFCSDFSQTAAAVMTTDLVTAERKLSLGEAFNIMQTYKKKVLPLVDAEKRLVGMYLFSDLQRIKFGHSDAYNVDHRGRLRVAAAIGTGDDGLRRAELLAKYADVLVVDTAHADSKPVIDTIREIKRTYDIDVVAGNISEGWSVKCLVDAGIDGIKVGQGPGSICTTRIVAGIGCPQVTAVYSVAKALEDMGRPDIPVCADGGIENSGSIVIAIGAGAHCVMLGRLLAGTTETPGTVDRSSEQPRKLYRGMGSIGAMEASRGARERYQQGETAREKLVPEGIEGAVPYVGDLDTVLSQYLGGLRAGMGYVGAASITELREKADFHRITGIGMAEGHPHGVLMIKDAPNYRARREQ